jgi:lipopolysaccharide export system protein LptA
MKTDAIQAALRQPWFSHSLLGWASRVVVFLALFTGVMFSQQPGTVVVSNFSVFPEFYAPPYAAQAKSRFQATSARPLPAGRYLAIQPRLNTFLQDGQQQVLIEAPQCFYDSVARSANSASRLQMRTADGKFLIEGEGFLWQQTNSSLVISNDVHTTVQPELLTRPGTNPPAGGSRLGQERLDIFSQHFDYSGETGLGNYRENVRVAGTNLGLQSRLLTLLVPMKERQLRTITAEENVTIDYSGVQARGQRAVYQADTGLANITGDPHWFADQREGKADELVIDATNRILRANGQAWLKMAGQTFGSVGLHPPGASTNAAPATNHFLEIFSDNYEISTNSATFREQVRAREWAGDQLKSTMTCGVMTASYAGTNQLQRMVADRGVVIEQDDQQLRARKAIYSGTNGLLELIDRPAWRAGAREGSGDQMSIAVRENELSVRGNAYMKLPADETGHSLSLGGGTNSPPSSSSSSNQFAELFSHEYVLRPQVALFEGKVRFEHPQRRLSCDHLAIHSSGEGGSKSESLVAEHSVDFDLISTDGQKVHGTCQKAVYNYAVMDGKTNDTVELTGNPVLQMTNGTIQNPILILDRTQNKLMAPGRYHVKGTLGNLTTNRFPVLKR